ncbi:GNAT family N-acetyltransferase [Glaesserella parasuis]|nr:GNAT family N-acetyltransferase [Glaesserella parasuis]
MKSKFIEEPLTKHHQREAFDCGNLEMNRFFKQYSRQSHEKGTSKTYISRHLDSQQIIGFYTITLSALDQQHLPELCKKRFGYYPIPLFTLARLAVDIRYQKQGIGGMLLVKALKRCAIVAEQVGGIGLLIEAKDEDISRWYQSYGAIPLKNMPLTLILLFDTIKGL